MIVSLMYVRMMPFLQSERFVAFTLVAAEMDNSIS